jgi:Neutral/alkaline non-lysosomal ceramidase, N-terminal
MPNNMKGKITLATFIILLAHVAVQSNGQPAAKNQTPVKLGVSQVNITPLQPVIMSGYDARKTPSTGVYDSLFATAFYFSAEKNAVLLITADLIGFPTVIVDSVNQMISSKTGIPVDRIMIVATHNHGGPAIRTYENKLPQANEDYIKELKGKLVTIAADAMKNPLPARMGIGKTICKLNINRRAVFADEGVWLGRNQDGPCDHELDVIKFSDQDDDLVAVLVNWPCHGTAGGQDNYRITGDWPSSAARFIKKLAKKNVVVGVTAGASADINPIYGPGNNFNEVEAVGYHVGNESWKTLAQTQTFPVNSLQFTSSTLIFPGKSAAKDHFPQSSYEKGPDVEIRLTALRVGDLVLCGISGEVMTEIGMEIKNKSLYPSTVILTHCNGSSGYICTDKAFSEGGYEVKVSRHMPGIERPLVRKCVGMINSF